MVMIIRTPTARTVTSAAFALMLVVTVWQAAPVDGYSLTDATAANSRSVRFPPAISTAAYGSASYQRYKFIASNPDSRFSQTITFQSPANGTSGGNGQSNMTIDVYITGIVPSAASSNTSFMVVSMSVPTVMTAKPFVTAKSDTVDGVPGHPDGALRTFVIGSCQLPVIGVDSFTDGCNVNPVVVCGPFPVPYPDQQLAASSIFANTQMLHISIPGTSLVPRNNVQVNHCAGPTEVTAIWRDGDRSDKNLVFKSSAAFQPVDPLVGLNIIDADLLIPRDVDPPRALTYVQGLFQISNPSATGSLWSPLIVQDATDTFPRYSIYSVFRTGNFVVDATNFVFGFGYVCDFDDALIGSTVSTTGVWTVQCSLPIKDAVTGRLSFTIPESIVPTWFQDNVKVELRSQSNLSLPVRPLSCQFGGSPTATPGAAGCLNYADCVPQNPLFFGAVDGTNQLYTHIVITISATVDPWSKLFSTVETPRSGPLECVSAFRAYVVYLSRTSSGASIQPASACPGITYECAVDAFCLPFQLVCDGSKDCSDGSDEASCSAWSLISTSSGFSKCPNIAPNSDMDFHVNVNNGWECERYAITHSNLYGGFLFASYTTFGSDCQLFSATCVGSLDVSDLVLLPNAPASIVASSVLKLSLVRNATLQGLLFDRGLLCTRTAYCSGTGFATTVTIPTPTNFPAALAQTCICTCDAFRFGNRCELSSIGSSAISSGALLRISGGSSAAMLVPSFTQSLSSLASGTDVRIVGANSTSIWVAASDFSSLSQLQSSVVNQFPSTATSVAVEANPVTSDGSANRCYNTTAFAYVCYYPISIATTRPGVPVGLLVSAPVAALVISNILVTTSDKGGNALALLSSPTCSSVNFEGASVAPQAASLSCPKASCYYVIDPLSVLVKVTLTLASSRTTIACGSSSSVSAFPSVIAFPSEAPLASIAGSSATFLEPPQISSATTSTFIILVIVAIAVAAPSFVISVYFCRVDSKLKESAKQAIEPIIALKRSAATAEMPLTGTMIWALRAKAVTHRGKEIAQYLHPRHHVIIWPLIMSFMIVSLGVTITLLVLQVPTKSSNFHLGIAFYEDSACNASSVTPTATGFSFIPATTVCSQAITLGFNVPVTEHFSASCLTAAQNYARIAIGENDKACVSATSYPVTLDKCMPQTARAGLPPFVMYKCLEPIEYEAVYADMYKELTPRTSDVYALANVVVAKDLVDPLGSFMADMGNFPTTILNDLGSFSAFFYYDVESSQTLQTSSSQPIYSFLATISKIDTSLLISPATADPATVVYQTTSQFFSTSVVKNVDAYEATIPANLKSFPATSVHDLPIGFLFNGYANRSNTPSMWYYPAVQGTDFDIGGVGSEATIGFWIRAGPDVSGFVVAVTDYFRILSTGESPLLTALRQFVLQGVGSTDSWFGGLNVYFAVYIDGPSKTLHFCSATDSYADVLDPNSDTVAGILGNELFDVSFDLDAMGALRVFTNTWHQIIVIIETPTNQDNSGAQTSGMQVRVVIDGQTSLDSTWTKCLPRTIKNIQPLTYVEAPQIPNSILQQGGAAIVAEPNLVAGLHGVFVTPSGLDRATIVTLGTVPMQNKFNANLLNYIVLGFFVCFVGASLLAILLFGVTLQAWEDSQKESEAMLLKLNHHYNKILGIGGAVKDQQETEAAHQCTLTNGKVYAAFHVLTAEKILDLDRELFIELMSEVGKIAISADGAKCDLMALVWKRGQAWYKPNAKYDAMRKPFLNLDRHELSQDGAFFVPVELWNDFVTLLENLVGDKLAQDYLSRKAAQAATNKFKNKTQAKVNVKVKFGGGKGGGKGGGGGGGKGGGRGPNSQARGANSSNSSAVNAISAPTQLIQPVILTFQAMATYVSSGLNLPGAYNTIVKPIATFFTFNWIHLSLPAILGAAIQFALAIFVAFLLIYFCFWDDHYFMDFVTSFALKRERVDRKRQEQAKEALKAQGPAQKKNSMVPLAFQKSSSSANMTSGGGPQRVPSNKNSFNRVESMANVPQGLTTSESVIMHILSEGQLGLDPLADNLPEESWLHMLQRFALPNRLSVYIDGIQDRRQQAGAVEINALDLLPARIRDKATSWDIQIVGSDTFVVNSDSVDQCHIKLDKVVIRCPLHEAVLREYNQTDVCINPYRCFVVQGNKRCPCVVGTMFCCRQQMPDGSYCPYSICETHARPEIIEFVLVSALTAVQQFIDYGVMGTIAYIVIALSSVVYFPVVQTCLLFLTCDPQYTCYFDHCWSDPDWKFLAAAIVVIFTAIIVGFCMPVAMLIVLLHRSAVLHDLFHRKEYSKMYLALDEKAIEELQEQREQEEKRKAHSSSLEQELEDQRRDTERLAGVTGIVARFFSNKISSMPTDTSTLMEKSRGVLHLTTVDFGEWQRFLAGDTTQLQILYRFLEFEYMILPPMLMFYRLAVILPGIFITNDDFTRLVAASMVEIIFGVFIFWTEPYINPWIDTMYRAGSVHNIIILGLTALNVVLISNGYPNGTLVAMIVVTLSYITFIMLLMFMTTIWPIVSYALKQRDIQKQMAKVGMRTTTLSSLFLNPIIHFSSFLSDEEREAVESAFEAEQNAVAMRMSPRGAKGDGEADDGEELQPTLGAVDNASEVWKNRVAERPVAVVEEAPIARRGSMRRESLITVQKQIRKARKQRKFLGTFGDVFAEEEEEVAAEEAGETPSGQHNYYSQAGDHWQSSTDGVVTAKPLDDDEGVETMYADDGHGMREYGSTNGGAAAAALGQSVEVPGVDLMDSEGEDDDEEMRD